MIQNQKGFTLLELMVTVAISSILAYCIFLSMRSGDELRQAADAKMQLYDSQREGLYKMIQEIRSSASTRVTLGTSTITFSIPNPSSPVTSTYGVDWTNAISVTYSIGGTNSNQVIRTANGASTVIANDVTALTFTGNATPPTLVTVSMSVQRSTAGGRTMTAAPIQLSAQARLRNV